MGGATGHSVSFTAPHRTARVQHTSRVPRSNTHLPLERVPKASFFCTRTENKTQKHDNIMAFKRFSVCLNKQGAPLGMKLGYDSGNVVITRFQEIDGGKGPAERLGLLAEGDILLGINGILVRGFLFNQIVDMVIANEVLALDFARKIEGEGIMHLLSNHPVSPSERKRLRRIPLEKGLGAIFKAFDKSGDGFLSREELENTPFATVHKNLMGKMDSDADGQISLSEWTSGWIKLQEEEGAEAVLDMMVHLIDHCQIDVSSILSEFKGESKEVVRENAGKAAKAIQAIAASDPSNWPLEALRVSWDESWKIVVERLLDDQGNLQNLKELFDVWDFDGNGFLDVPEIRSVLYHFKRQGDNADNILLTIFSEDMDNKINYNGIEVDPLVTKEEFPAFILHFCADTELNLFEGTLRSLKRSVHLVYRTLQADRVFKRLSPLHKPLDKGIISSELDAIPGAAELTMTVDGASEKLDRTGFRSFLIDRLGGEKSTIGQFKEVITAFVDKVTSESSAKAIEKLFNAWDFDNSGALEHFEIEAVMDRLDSVYDMLYDSDTYAVSAPSNKSSKTKMRRASKLALKEASGDSADTNKITREQFPKYIEQICTGFGEGGFNNFLYFMEKTVLDVRRVRVILDCLDPCRETFIREGGEAFLRRINESLPKTLKLDDALVSKALTQNVLIPRLSDGSVRSRVIEFADRLLYLTDCCPDEQFQAVMNAMSDVRDMDEVNPEIAPGGGGCCVVS